MAATPIVVLLPVWGAGHLMSLLEAGKRLLATGGRALSLTVLVMQPPTEQEASEVAAHIHREEAAGLDIRFQHLPAVDGAVAALGQVAPERIHAGGLRWHRRGVEGGPWTGRGTISREAAELERAVKTLMGGGEEGLKVREKAVEMKVACRKAVEERGSSYAALQRLSVELYEGAVVKVKK